MLIRVSFTKRYLKALITSKPRTPSESQSKWRLTLHQFEAEASEKFFGVESIHTEGCVGV